MSDQLKGKRIAFLVANEGVEQVELTEPVEGGRARRAPRPTCSRPRTGEVQAFNHLDKGDTFDGRPDRRRGRRRRLRRPGAAGRRRQPRPAAHRRPTRSRSSRAFFEAGKPVGGDLPRAVDADRGRTSSSGRTLTSWPSLQTDLRNAGGDWVDEEVHVDAGPGHQPQARRPRRRSTRRSSRSSPRACTRASARAPRPARSLQLRRRAEARVL